MENRTDKAPLPDPQLNRASGGADGKDTTILEWCSFNIDIGEQVDFNKAAPSAPAAAAPVSPTVSPSGARSK